MTLEQIEEYRDKGLITVRPHPNLPLYICNYTPKVQYERLWDDITLQCRGLVIDHDGVIRARPFKKFFNLEEHESYEIPSDGYQAYDKLDGSLIIKFFYEGKWIFASRGSFTSEQAIEAEKIFAETGISHNDFDPAKTYMFEVIYPKNRIVVDYGQTRSLILLGIIQTDSGAEQDIITHPWPVQADRVYIDSNNVYDFLKIQADNKEGFVLKHVSGFRFKVKMEEYKRLHRILTNVTSRTIWEYLKDGKPMEELIAGVPDEFYDWLHNTKANLLEKFHSLKGTYHTAYSMCLWSHNAIYKHHGLDFPKWLFTKSGFDKSTCSFIIRLHQNRDIDEQIWKKIKPEHEKPFTNEN